MRKMNALLERIGAHVERIDVRLCRMERGRPSRAPPSGDAAGPFPVAVRAGDASIRSARRAARGHRQQLAEDDELTFALACRRLR
jgi:hypothetical protein